MKTDSNSNLHEPLVALNAALGTYLARVNETTSKSEDCRATTGNAGLKAAGSLVASVLRAVILIRGTAEAEAVALDVATGAISPDDKYVTSTVTMLEDRIAAVPATRKAVEDAVRSFLGAMDTESAAAKVARDAIAPKKDEKAGDKPANGSDTKKS
jgi:hypothetical protein